MNMSDLEKAIREAEAAGDLPELPEEEVTVQNDAPIPDTNRGEERVQGREPEVLTVNFDSPSFQESSNGSEEITSLLRELIDVCRRGFGY